jgi:hypothetical protein
VFAVFVVVGNGDVGVGVVGVGVVGVYSYLETSGGQSSNPY